MPKTVGEFLDENIKHFRKLQKLGIVPCTLLNNFSIYSHYKSLNVKSMPSKMDRYQFTAESLRVSERSVRYAIQEMEKSMQ